MFYLRKEDFLRILKENNEDYERYCQKKEKMLIYNEFNDISLKCDTCYDKNHLKFECLLNRIKGEKTEIIKKLLDSKPQIRRKYKRKPSLKKNALNLVKIFKNLAPNFQLNNEEFKEKTMDDDSESSNSELSFDNAQCKLSKMLNSKEWNLQRNIQKDEKNEVYFEENFEKPKNFEVFFPHNNIEEILHLVNSKRKKVKKQFLQNEIGQTSFSSWNGSINRLSEKANQKKVIIKVFNNDFAEEKKQKKFFNFLSKKKNSKK